MGEKPLLAVVDQSSGEVLNTYPIGRGNDGVAFDPVTRRVFALNGVDANLVIYDQVSPSELKLVEAVTTRPFARTIAYDPKSKKLYSVAGQGSYDPAKPTRKDISPFYPNTYLKDTLTVLTYAPK
jgi:DNA-binding beta-propeller fold protein YncE